MTESKDNIEDILLDIDEYRQKELIDYYVEDLERLAAENQVTVDYYIAEFTWLLFNPSTTHHTKLWFNLMT